MYLIDKLGWFAHARRCPSNNFNSRPEDDDVSLLVIHNISLPPGQFGTGCVQAFFCNELDFYSHPALEALAGVEVSAHLFIDRRGDCFQFVSLLDRAWHAGVSRFQGRENCNDFSVGIELEGEDMRPYTEAQYRELAAVTQAMLRRFPRLVPERISGHSDIAPGRKTDPGPAFDWAYYKSLL